MSFIHHTYGPHVDRPYLLRALKLLCMPWRYRNGPAIEPLRSALGDRFQAPCFLFASGRESLLALFRAMKLQPGEEVIIQGYTCIVVPNAIHAAGGVPIYADIDQDSLNMTPETVRPLITARTRAIICQHTFGIPAQHRALRALCNEHNLVLIEDCAHAIDSTKDDRGIGLHGDAVVLSFGRDKVFSGISGGAVIARRREWHYVLKELEQGAAPLTCSSIAVLLSYAPRMALIVRPMGQTLIGRGMLWLLKKLLLIAPVLTKE